VLVSDSTPIETLISSSLDQVDSEKHGDVGEEDVEIEQRTQFNDDPEIGSLVPTENARRV